MQVNTTTVVDRGNRPNVSQIVGLRTYFINDGAYVDPYEISSVQLFRKGDTLTPLSVTGTDGLVTATPKMAFAAFGTQTNGTNVHCTITAGTDVGTPCADAFTVTNYIPAVTASGIYRMGQGEYVVVLDQTLALSGWDYTTSTQVAAASLSAVNDYVDLWTVRLNPASKYQVITNQFSLNEDTFFAFTEPLLLTTSNKLMNKHVRLGETIDLKVATETTIQNKDIPHNVQNIFKDSVITGATVNISKVNQDVAFIGPFTPVIDGAMTITKDNTLIYNWNTTDLKTYLSVTDGTFGSITGTYSVQVKYTLLNEIILSPLFYLTVS